MAGRPCQIAKIESPRSLRPGLSVPFHPHARDCRPSLPAPCRLHSRHGPRLGRQSLRHHRWGRRVGLRCSVHVGYDRHRDGTVQLHRRGGRVDSIGRCDPRLGGQSVWHCFTRGIATGQCNDFEDPPGCGVFNVDPAGTETVLYSFTFADGAAPDSGVIRDSAGNLYGTTFNGGGGTSTSWIPEAPRPSRTVSQGDRTDRFPRLA